MPRKKTRETKIRKMIEMGLSDTEIAGALHIKKIVIAELRENGGAEIVQSKKNIKPKKKAGEPGGIGDPSNSKSQNSGGEPGSPHQEFHASGESGGSTGVNFVGGKKNMGKKKENDPDPEEFEYECPFCHYEFNERSETCPRCGKPLSGYDD